MANSGSTEESSKQGGKSKTGKNSKDETARTNGKGKQKTKAKGDKQPLHPAETPGSVYSNMTPLSMSPLQGEGTVYENYAFNKDEVDGNETDKNRAEEQSEMVNPDGLVYTTIAFSTDQQRKAKRPPPERETTEYAGIDFMKLAAK
ncbi:uncharacterized protein [Littorina saxatilis]|uniref:uncharacterized protein n=1 Tax=Littorina saxatilis TaxID=31220 RepID=UPI0038B4E972